MDEVIVEPSPVPGSPGSPEVHALLRMSEALAHAPQNALQHLVSTAMRLTHAESAGLSVEDVEAGRAVLRWKATAGEFARYLDGTMPRDFSPCGTAMDRRCTLVMSHPARYYPYIAELHVEVRTVMLVPFMRQGRFVGTLWAIRHSTETNFSTEDKRILQGLVSFASAILDANGRKG